MRRSKREAATKPINYKSFGNSGQRLPPQQPIVSTSSTSSDSESDLEKPSLHTAFNLYQSLYESDQSDTSSTDVNLSKLVQTLSLQESTEPIMDHNIKKLSVEHNVLCSDIADFGMDYDIEFMSFNELEDVLQTLMKMRNRLKIIHDELKQVITDEDVYEKTFLKVFTDAITNARAIIQRIHSRRQAVRPVDKPLQDAQQNKLVSDFLMKEVKGTITTLKAVFDKKPAEFNYDELVLAERNISANQQSMNNLSKQMEKILLNQYNFPNDEIKTVTTSYDALVVSKSIYVTNLEATLKDQEVAKEQKFQSSKLNIKLTKFKGYDSSSDFYSFKTDFEKLHAKSTPSAHLPDLIKNNYLEGPALTLVKGVDDIDEIWRRLKSSYGDPKLLLSKKLSTLNKATRLWRNRDPEKQIETISSMLNFMRDVMNLSRKHQIENFLFYGKTLEDIYQLMDDARQTKWFSFLEGKTLDQPDVWEELIKFLETELSIQQLKLLHCSHPTTNDTGKQTPGSGKQGPSGVSRSSSHHVDGKNPIIQTKCFICGATGHIQTNGPNNSKLLQYFSCPEFVQMKPSQRFNTLRQKGYCTQCLFPGAQQSKGKHQEGRCQREFTCPHPSHDNFEVKKHVLVCQDHASTPECHQVFQNFKERCIIRQSRLQQFSKDIKLAFHIDTQSFSSRHKTTQPLDVDNINTDDDDDNNAIYILQTIIVDGQQFTIFFDSGCSDMVISENAVKRLGERARIEYDGDIPIGGVGNVQTYSSGLYKVNIPLHNGHEARLKGLCLPKITSTFPTYQLKQVEEDIITAYQQTGGNPDDLPSLPSSVGGEIDIMLGIKYHRYHPKEVFQLKTGLTIFQSLFNNSDGSRGVVGGPHRAFNIINQHHIAVNQMNTFLATHRQLSSYQLTTLPDAHLIHVKVEKDHQQNLMLELDDQQSTALVIRNSKIFEDAENAGSQITYRCVHCRDCKECKISESIESISLKEEVEQHLINQSVSVDLKNRMSLASLPLLHNPETKLANNKHKALKVYFQQLRKLDKEPSDKKDVIASEAKLQSMGYVDYVENLTPQQQQMLSNSEVINFIPWRAVWKPNSLSTPCRVVFDASQPTDSGYSLNDILAKGTNNMNRLVEILIRWSMHQTAFHTDIRKMYNSVRLREHHWCLQRYIWEEQLDKTKIPKEKIIKTLIYGVKSSGNQSERALRETGRLSSEDYPEVATIVMKDIYVDDCLSGEKSMELATQRADELEIVVNRGGFSLKGITFSHQKPKPDLTSDGESIGVAGMKWYPEEDVVSLDVSELNFAKKVRGKKPVKINDVPLNLTRRHCVSKVAELYDISGKITPLTATMKLDLHHLVDLGIGWDERIPDNLRQIWDSHFKMMEEISQIKYRRAIVPEDAINLEINSIDTGDASKNIACVAIYARFKRKCGKFSCQLVFARSRLIPDGTTQPRGELFAATLNAHTGEVVRRAFGTHLKSSLKLTDSQIALFWINGAEKQLKPWVRNRVAEIHRFTELASWKFVSTENMIADIGTRRGTTISDVSANSTWFNGFDWMHGPENTFPMKSVNQVKLTNEELKAAKKEQILPIIDPITNVPPSIHLSSISQRFDFSEYLISPIKYGWTKSLAIMNMVFQFVSKFACCKKRLSRIALEPCEKSTFQYFFTKATEEVQAFSSKKKYERISTMKDGILYYIGRILPTNNVTATGKLTNIMLDLTASSFFVPLVDRHSPIAYSIVDHIHWNHPVAKHAGVETVLRYVLQIAYIIDGRDLVKLVRRRCERCRYIAKQTINVEMGPISNHNLNIAPPFYSTQVDLCGPFTAYSNFHKRTTIKIWMVIFCCTTTSATKIKVMDDFSTPSFILSFTRFASEVGYPKYLLPDEGSQLVKGCGTLKLSFRDIQNRLFQDVLVNFQTCPVSGHHMHGKVERKIQEIKKSLNINFDKYRFSVLQWETVASQLSNTINDAPLALNGHSEFEISDLLTPNRLLLGRNNDRSPCFPVNITSKPDKFLKQNEELFNAWFEVWLTVHLPKLMHQPKWFDNTFNLKVGDIVLFLKQESQLCNTYQYGKIKSVETSKDGRIRRVQVEYRNHTENFNRITYRAVRGLVMIHPVDELPLFEELILNDINNLSN